MKTLLVLAIILTSLPALAQGTTTLEQKIAAQIGALVIQNAQLQAQIEQQQAEIAKLTEEVKKAAETKAK